jgi:uncharacterized protein YecA (UPF0149 family)
MPAKPQPNKYIINCRVGPFLDATARLNCLLGVVTALLSCKQNLEIHFWIILLFDDIFKSNYFNQNSSLSIDTPTATTGHSNYSQNDFIKLALVTW